MIVKGAPSLRGVEQWLAREGAAKV